MAFAALPLTKVLHMHHCQQCQFPLRRGCLSHDTYQLVIRLVSIGVYGGEQVSGFPINICRSASISARKGLVWVGELEGQRVEPKSLDSTVVRKVWVSVIPYSGGGVLIDYSRYPGLSSAEGHSYPMSQVTCAFACR